MHIIVHANCKPIKNWKHTSINCRKNITKLYYTTSYNNDAQNKSSIPIYTHTEKP